MGEEVRAEKERERGEAKRGRAKTKRRIGLTGRLDRACLRVQARSKGSCLIGALHRSVDGRKACLNSTYRLLHLARPDPRRYARRARCFAPSRKVDAPHRPLSVSLSLVAINWNVCGRRESAWRCGSGHNPLQLLERDRTATRAADLIGRQIQFGSLQAQAVDSTGPECRSCVGGCAIQVHTPGAPPPRPPARGVGVSRFFRFTRSWSLPRGPGSPGLRSWSRAWSLSVRVYAAAGSRPEGLSMRSLIFGLTRLRLRVGGDSPDSLNRLHRMICCSRFPARPPAFRFSPFGR